MQFKLLALSALSATVSAQQSSSGLNQASVYAVLATALPSSLVAEALTNPGAVSSEIASEFSQGITPTWFTALPTPIQSYLLHQAGNSNATATGMSNSTVAAGNGTSHSRTVVVTTHGRTTHLTGAGHTNTRTGAGGMKTQTGASSSGSASAGSGSSSSSSGGASMPTAIIGAGLAGAVGMVGLLAL